MKNPVARHAPRFNKPKVEPDKKRRAKAGYTKHKSSLASIERDIAKSHAILERIDADLFEQNIERLLALIEQHNSWEIY